MSEQDEQSGDDEDNIKVYQGLTDEERRDIRKSQRLLRKEIPDLDVDEARERNNAIHKKVRYIRESVLDAENLEEIAKKAANKVDQMIQVGEPVVSLWYRTVTCWRYRYCYYFQLLSFCLCGS
jgi:hypothetical protein